MERRKAHIACRGDFEAVDWYQDEFDESPDLYVQAIKKDGGVFIYKPCVFIPWHAIIRISFD